MIYVTFLDHFQRTLLYLGVGAVLATCTDTVSSIAGLWSTTLPPRIAGLACLPGQLSVLCFVSLFNI